MRVLSMDIKAFGRLRDWRSGPLHPHVVVVYGPNEAGKSTLFAFLSAMLYGLYPADRTRHPYVPWEGETLSGSVELSLRDGSVVRVHRRLLSQPQGVLEYVNDPHAGPVDLRNRALGATGHIPRQVFEDVFALTLDELRFPADEVWELIQERLLGHLGSDFLLPARRVAEQISKEAERLWRPDRRGKHRDKQVEERLQQLRIEREEALARDRELREAYKRQEALQAEIDALTEERRVVQTRLRRAARLAPVRRTLQRIAELKEAAGDLSPWSGVPESPLEVLARLEEQLQAGHRVLAELDRVLAVHQSRIDAFTEDDRRLLALGERINGAVADLARLEHARARRREAALQLQETEARLDERSRHLFGQPWNAAWASQVLTFSDNELRSHLRRLRELEHEYREARARTAAVQAQETPSFDSLSYRWGVLVVAFGVALTAIGGLGFVDILLWGGLLLFLLGLLQLWSRWRERSRVRIEQARRRRAEQEALAVENAVARRRDAAFQRVEELLSALPLLPERLEAPDESLLFDIQALQSELRRQEDLLRQAREAEREEEETMIRLRSLLAAVKKPDTAAAWEEAAPSSETPADRRAGEDRAHASVSDDAAEGSGAPPGYPGDSDPAEADRFRAEVEQEVRRLPALLAAAQERRELAAASQAAVPDVLRRRRDEAMRLRGLEQERDALVAALLQLGADPQEGARVLAERRNALRQALALETDLQRQHPDLEQLLEEIAAADAEGTSWTVSEAAQRMDEEALAAMEARLEAAWKELARLREHIHRLEEQPTLDEIDGEIAALEEERAAARRERDRLTLMARVLAEAERRFREEHQPDVLRRAGEYLHIITGGRYVRLILEDAPGGRRLLLKQGAEPYLVEVDSRLSRGTLDQVYLSLRLAVVEHLDQEQEPLPLFLDEVLVNWDSVRRENGLRVLEKLSASRQVFLFTCHEWLAEELVSRLGAQRLDLPAPGPGLPVQRSLPALNP